MGNPVQIVIFGASGDLAAQKLVPALAALAGKAEPPGGFILVGVARRAKSDDAFRQELRALQAPGGRAGFDALADRIHYVAGDVQDPEAFGALGGRLDALPGGGGADRLFYFSLMPELFGPAVVHLDRAGLLAQPSGGPWRRVVVEKPFGRDLATARALNQTLLACLREEQIYRIDHYLGKETVQNLFALRFNNTIFEPVWNRRHVELVQITVAETGGVERGRAGYYDRAGAMSDVLQNHMLQILALVAMEPPSSLDPEEVRGQKVSVLKSLRFGGQGSSVRARYAAGTVAGQPVPGYLEEGVPAASSTETFGALRAGIETWRWSGVPFLLRHGKRLPRRFTEVAVQFRVPPIQLFDGLGGEADASACQLRPNHLILSIQPREAVTLRFGVKAPGPGMAMAPAELAFSYPDRFGHATAPAYERLLLDALNGDPTLFLRNDEVEAAWTAVDALPGGPVLAYPAGTWGPPEAERLFHGCEGHWSHG